jgi:hypothetical protein
MMRLLLSICLMVSFSFVEPRPLQLTESALNNSTRSKAKVVSRKKSSLVRRGANLHIPFSTNRRIHKGAECWERRRPRLLG